jgi:Tol biopolymer transport system component
VAGILTLAWWAVHSRSVSKTGIRSGAPVQRNLTRLTVDPGLQTDVTWSPDGRFIAYASDRAGNFDIWVQSVAGGEPVQITESPAHDTEPDWSPDGSSIAYRSEREGGGLFVVPALGGIERQLTSVGTHPSWSPDNREILFVDGPAPGDGEWWMKLYAVSPDEGAPREILADFLQRGGWYWVGRHPDGRISALGRHRHLGPGFYTVTRDGTQIVASKQAPTVTLRVTAGGGKDRRRFWWHPSGTALYLQTDSNAVYNLWKVRVDVSTLAWLSVERLTTGAGRDVVPALSRDGTRLAFTTERESSRLWVFPIDSDAWRLGPGTPLTEDGAVAQGAALSPDGRYVAYSLARPGINRPDVWITNIGDGGSELVSTDAYVGCWSPDGRAIVYNRYRLDREPMAAALAVRRLGATERLVSRWSTDFFFVPTDWASGSDILGTYCPSDSTGPCVLALWPTTNPDADKPERILVARSGMNLWQARLSPNRRWLSFVVDKPDGPSSQGLVVAPADGTAPERWTPIAADHTFPDKPRWAPDGRRLYFISRRPSSYFNLWGVRFDPERGRPVGEPFALSGFDSPSMFISPDLAFAEMGISSLHAVLTIKNVSGSIWMLDNVDK